MKLILLTCAADALAIFTLSIPVPGITSEASASKMNGNGANFNTGSHPSAKRFQRFQKTGH